MTRTSSPAHASDRRAGLPRRSPNTARRPAPQRGLSLVVVLLILVIVALLGAAGAQIALLGERGSRSDRDTQLAFLSAEAGLNEATQDLKGLGVGNRGTVFAPASLLPFVSGCGDAGTSKGLCALTPAGTQPAWLAVDFLQPLAHYATYGEFTGNAFESGSVGIKPAAAPRYVIEPVSFYELGQSRSTPPSLAYRVTAMGFGPRTDSQSVVQMIYRKD